MIRSFKKKHNTVTLRELYNYYLSQQQEDEHKLPYSKWRPIIEEMLWGVSRLMIIDNMIIKIDGGLGLIGIVKYKEAPRRAIDFYNTKKLGKTIYHTNLHTDSYIFRFSWRKMRTYIGRNPNMSLYVFLPVQDQKDRKIGKRGLAKWVIDCSNSPFIKDYDAPFSIK